MKTLCPDKRSGLLVAIFPTLFMGLMNGFWLESLLNCGPVAFYAVDILQWIIVPSLMWLYVLRPLGIRPKSFGLSPRPIILTCQVLCAACLLWFSYRPAHFYAYRLLWPYAGSFGYAGIIPAAAPWSVLAAFYFSATAAVVEEIVFRGLPWLYLSTFLPSRRCGFWYLLITPVLFAACHSEQGPHGVIATWVFGLVMAVLYGHIRNLWPLILAHFAIDMAAFWPSAV